MVGLGSHSDPPLAPYPTGFSGRREVRFAFAPSPGPGLLACDYHLLADHPCHKIAVVSAIDPTRHISQALNLRPFVLLPHHHHQDPD